MVGVADIARPGEGGLAGRMPEEMPHPWPAGQQVVGLADATLGLAWATARSGDGAGGLCV
jgi:hypothetical protein